MKRSSRLPSFIICLSLSLAVAQLGCRNRWRVVDDTVDGGPVLDSKTDLPPYLFDGPRPDGPVSDYTIPSSPCKEISPINPHGHKPVTLRHNGAGDWLAAMDHSSKYNDLKILAPALKMAAAIIDHRDVNQEVAGFILSRDTKLQDIQDELSGIITTISNTPPGGSGAATVRASGTQKPSHDLFPSIKGTIMDVTLDKVTNVSAVRNYLAALLLGRPLSHLSNLPGAFGAQQTKFVVRFVTVKRFQQKINSTTGKPEVDKNGYSIDTGNKAQWRVVIMGSVARQSAYQNVNRETGLVADDLSNGTAFTRATGKLINNGCETSVIQNLPVADIIWVVDESGSMSDNRKDIVANANNFFNRALSSGLDFRMGVTNVCTPMGSYKYAVGKFCSAVNPSTSHDGGEDRFLLPNEQHIFSSCVQNPPGYEGGSEYGLVNARSAVEKHLPRAANDPKKVRHNATLAIIVVTDEIPNSLTNTIGYSNYKQCVLPPGTQTLLDINLKEYLDLFSGKINLEAQAMFHVIGGTCNNSCGAQVAHGYRELAQKLGGQVGDVCQKNLGNTLQVIINSILGKVSPIQMKYTPISSTLAISINGMAVKRSRVKGFEYNSASNSISFINIPYQKGSKVVIGYKRWN